MNNDSTLHIRLNIALKEELEEIAKRFSVKPAVVVREALEDYVNSNPAPTTSIINIDKL
jgi:predicted DNA-binding protein